MTLRQIRIDTAMVAARGPVGRDLRIATMIALLSAAGHAAFGSGPVQPRTFFLALDAVPYTAVAELYSSGGAEELFGELGRPIPLISTFPSTTTVALAAALAPFGLEMSPGYEARFFDWRERSIRGGGPISFFRIDFPWRRFFDWSKKSVVRSAVASLRPVAVSEKRALAAFEAFLASERRNFFAYIDSTDAAAHLRGPSSLDEMFRRLGVAIREARRSGEEFRVVVFSDHGIAGGEPLENSLPGIVERLKRFEFRPAKRLRDERDVVLTPYGLVSSFEAYSADDAVPSLAEVLVSARGVELCAYRGANEFWVVDSGGLAMIARKQGRWWAYLPQAGDPLRYREVVAALRAGAVAADRSGQGEDRPGEHGVDEASWFNDRAWFEATRGEHFPDALHRIAGGFELVTHPASVICSLEPGYMYGPGTTATAARLTGGRLRWTHGALHWEPSAGFLLTDSAHLDSTEALRLGDALGGLASPLAGRDPTPRDTAADPTTGRARGAPRDDCRF